MEELICLKKIITFSLDSDRCVGCGMCLIVCPHAVFTIKKAPLAAVPDVVSVLSLKLCQKKQKFSRYSYRPLRSRREERRASKRWFWSLRALCLERAKRTGGRKLKSFL